MSRKMSRGSTVSRSDGSCFPRQSSRLYLNLSIYWFALSFLWAGMITIIMQRLVEEIAGPRKDLYLGWTLAIGALVSTVVCLVIGTMSDHSRFAMGKRRPFIIVGTLLSIPALLWQAQIRSLGSIALLILNFCLIQFWVNVATSPYQAMMPDMVPKEHQGTASAYMGMSTLLGQLGGLTLCGMLMAKPGGLWRIEATLSGLLLLAMLYTIFSLPERPANANPAPQQGILVTLADSFRVNPKEHPDFFRLIGSRFVINMGFYSATEFLYYYIKDTLRVPDPTTTAAMVFIVATGSGLIGNFPAGILSDRMSKKRVVYISCAVAGIAALIFLFAKSLTVAFSAAVVFGIGLGAFQAVDWAFATNLLPEKDEAKHMGVWHIAFTVPQVIAPLIGGLVAYLINRQWGHGMGYRAVLFLVVIYLAFGTVMIHPIRERIIGKAQ